MEHNYDNIIAQSKSIWTEITKSQPEKTGAKLFDEASLDMLSHNSNTVIAILNLKDYRQLYVSPNGKTMFGYVLEDKSAFGVLQYIRAMTLEHLFFPLIAGKWYVKCLKSVAYEEKIEQKIVFIGAKFKTAWGKPVRTFIQTAHLEEDEKRNPIHIINTVQDIGHLMKDDFWWARYSYGNDPQKVKYYHSGTGLTTEGDILSEREKDILRLIRQGFESPEIADKLFISLATVHTHRRNMLARTGMKDATALLQIALSVSMI